MTTKYEPTDQELIRWVGAWDTEDAVNGAGYYFNIRTPVPGEVAVIHSHGKLRRGIVISVGRLNAKVALTTPSAIETHRNGHELTRVAGKAMPFNMVGLASGSAELADGTFGTPEETTEAAPAEEAAPAHPFGSYPEPHSEMTASDREGELVEIRARGPFEEVQVVRGRIVGQVAGLQNTPGFYVVQHEGAGTYQTYDRRVVSPVQEEPEPDPVATQPVPPAEETAQTAQTAPAGSGIVKALERLWSQIQANHPELPAVVIVTGSGMVGPPRWGHFRANGWTERAEKGAALDLAIGEMFVAGETLARGAAHTLETALHEAAHVLAKVREVKDTSRQGRWHNQKFRALAEEMGLEYPKESAHPQVGFSECLMTPGTREEYAEVIEELDRAIRLTIALPEFLATTPEGEEGHGAGEHIHHGGRKPRQPGATSTTNNLKATCGCEVPRIIRASRKVLEEGDIVCGKCREPFTAPEPEVEPEDG